MLPLLYGATIRIENLNIETVYALSNTRLINVQSHLEWSFDDLSELSFNSGVWSWIASWNYFFFFLDSISNLAHNFYNNSSTFFDPVVTNLYRTNWTVIGDHELLLCIVFVINIACLIPPPSLNTALLTFVKVIEFQ